jgi:hypothetical protein
MKDSIKVVIPLNDREEDFLLTLLETGLWGRNLAEAVRRIVDERLQQVMTMDEQLQRER